jgi:hypothetical protein
MKSSDLAFGRLALHDAEENHDLLGRNPSGNARHPITTLISRGRGAGVRSMKYTDCPSPDTSNCVPQ